MPAILLKNRAGTFCLVKVKLLLLRERMNSEMIRAMVLRNSAFCIDGSGPANLTKSDNSAKKKLLKIM